MTSISNPGLTLPTEFLLHSVNTRFLLCPSHTTALSELADQHRPDNAIAETWVRPISTPTELIDVTPSSYTLFSAPRTSHSSISKYNCMLGSATAFLLKELSIILQSSAHAYSSFEYSSITIKLPTSDLTEFNLYRPTPSSPYSQPFTTFTDQLSFFLPFGSTTPREFIFTGDFNIHLDDPTDQQSTLFMSLLANFNHTQHVSFPLHTLDLVITSASTSLNPIISQRHQHNL